MKNLFPKLVSVYIWGNIERVYFMESLISLVAIVSSFLLNVWEVFFFNNTLFKYIFVYFPLNAYIDIIITSQHQHISFPLTGVTFMIPLILVTNTNAFTPSSPPSPYHFMVTIFITSTAAAFDCYDNHSFYHHERHQSNCLL